MKDLGMDSLDAVEVVMAFEDEFGKFQLSIEICCVIYFYIYAVGSPGVEISDEEAEKIFSCKDAIELLKTKLDIH